MTTVQSSRTPRSLADDLRSRTPGQMRLLLHLRPDLLNPWPTDLSQLARRAADDGSVLEAMGSLNTPALRVLEVLAAVHEATAEQIQQALGEDVDDVISSLWDRALLWGGPIYKIVRAAQQTFGPFPCGLSAAGHVTPDPQAVRDAALEMDPDRLRYLVWENPVSTTDNPLTTQRSEQYVVPREVALILRDGMYLPPAEAPHLPDPVAPAPDSSLWNPLAGVRYVLTELARDPLPWNAQRGVSRRTLQDRAQGMGLPIDDLVAWLELAAVAGLVGGVESAVHPTADANAWLALSPRGMWQALIAGWLDSDRPLLRCRPDELGCLTTSGLPRAAHHRRQVLSVWPNAVMTRDDIRALLEWERPRLLEAAAMAADFTAELTVLGLLVAGVPNAAINDPAAAEVPDTDNALIIQPDHTVIAGANVDSATWSLLYDIARLESWGPVTMHRIEVSKLRAALVHRDPAEVLRALAAASRTPLSQSLEYTVNDAARGTPVQVSRVTLIRTTTDDAQRVRELGWQELAPGIFATSAPAESVRRLLNEAGVAVTSAEEPVVAAPIEYPRPMSHSPTAIDRLVEHLVEAATPVPEPPELHPADPATLREALAAPRVWLEFNDGQRTLTHLLEPFEVRSGLLSGWSLSAARTVTVPLSRIAALRIVDE